MHLFGNKLLSISNRKGIDLYEGTNHFMAAQPKTMFVSSLYLTRRAPTDPTTRYVRRYILSLTAMDHTGSSWLTAFQEVAEAILGCTAQEAAAAQVRPCDGFLGSRGNGGGLGPGAGFDGKLANTLRGGGTLTPLLGLIFQKSEFSPSNYGAFFPEVLRTNSEVQALICLFLSERMLQFLVYSLCKNFTSCVHF